MAFLCIVAGSALIVIVVNTGYWVLLILGIPLLMCGIVGVIERDQQDAFEMQLRRLERGVQRTRHELSRLEAQALKAMNDEAIRQRLKKTN